MNNECGTNTNMYQLGQVPLEIHFKGSLTYAEKLMLKCHRRTQLGALPAELVEKHLARQEARRADAEGVAPLFSVFYLQHPWECCYRWCLLILWHAWRLSLMLPCLILLVFFSVPIVIIFLTLCAPFSPCLVICQLHFWRLLKFFIHDFIVKQKPLMRRNFCLMETKELTSTVCMLLWQHQGLVIKLSLRVTGQCPGCPL